MKKVFLISLPMLFCINFIFAQEVKYQLSSHILDITQGKPAPNVKISLSIQGKDGKWAIIDEKVTDEDGRIKDFLKEEKTVDRRGIYKLTFNTASYFKQLGQDSFYPFIEVVFELKDNNHYHVPITLSPFGYSTYRGN
ncbi:MAG: hydroxyisourate hydrolase [Ginsengibacter sp.]